MSNDDVRGDAHGGRSTPGYRLGTEDPRIRASYRILLPILLLTIGLTRLAVLLSELVVPPGSPGLLFAGGGTLLSRDVDDGHGLVDRQREGIVVDGERQRHSDRID